MIEVFQTNITDRKDADRVLNKIHSGFPGFVANFDLDDCDHILRINSGHSSLCANTIIRLVEDLGFVAFILPDVVIPEPTVLH